MVLLHPAAVLLSAVPRDDSLGRRTLTEFLARLPAARTIDPAPHRNIVFGIFAHEVTGRTAHS